MVCEAILQVAMSVVAVPSPVVGSVGSKNSQSVKLGSPKVSFSSCSSFHGSQFAVGFGKSRVSCVLESAQPTQYPPGMQRYESMVVLRPDMTEEERTAVTEKYEEALVAGGALDVEMFNRGMQPLAYNIRKKNMGGLLNKYLDGIYLLFTYVTKPESQVALLEKFNQDDDVIRSTTFKLKI